MVNCLKEDVYYAYGRTDKSKDRIPEQFQSIEEIQEFWDTHSSADYWDEMDDIEMQLSPALKSKLELKLKTL